jgi:hypothetical protein
LIPRALAASMQKSIIPMYHAFRVPFAESSMPAHAMSMRTHLIPAAASLSSTACRSGFV